MKFLVNSKYLHSKIAEAIGKTSAEFHREGDEIIFVGVDGTTEMDVHVLIDENIKERFEPERWRRVLSYLKLLPEQPLTVELSYDRIEITGVAVFNIITLDP